MRYSHHRKVVLLNCLQLKIFLRVGSLSPTQWFKKAENISFLLSLHYFQCRKPHDDIAQRLKTFLSCKLSNIICAYFQSEEPFQEKKVFLYSHSLKTIKLLQNINNSSISTTNPLIQYLRTDQCEQNQFELISSSHWHN